ncbi:2,4-dihydroxyhept-2-ene-1,7-dioic acid aldolase [Alkalispirochaeta odontotermitis]|nr:2,4-dihydroxyhept-2-ene-1,7-dioic acid aldolase [Alkalispirochaeta odontotermitis]CAB1078021.1 2,4-dihydroxyhept-2-ene-1,7-dioic acid aldolase (EC [Olavius algarvensis Delta 1 endosymbiont]
MHSNIRARLKNGDTLIGTLVTLTAPEVAEIMAELGYDWLFIDTEHGSFNAQAAQGLLQAADHRCPCVVRIPANDEVWIKKALDIGAAGIIAPGVKSAAEAEQIVRLCKYPPRGNRGVGIGRAHGYGLNFKEYVENANDEIAVVIQAENTDAVANIAEIVRVPDVDAVLIGPYDLSASMGKMGRIQDEEVQAGIASVTKCCRNAGVPLGIFADSAQSAAPFIEQGYTLVAISTDCLHMAQGARAELEAVKKLS